MGQSKKRQTHVCQNSDSTDMANWITIDVIKVFRWRIIGGIISCIFDVLAIYLSSLFLDVWSYVLVFSACLEAKLSRPARFSGQLHFYWFRVMCVFLGLHFFVLLSMVLYFKIYCKCRYFCKLNINFLEFQYILEGNFQAFVVFICDIFIFARF